MAKRPKKWTTTITTTVNYKATKIEITIDWDNLARRLANKAHANASRRSGIAWSTVKGRLIEVAS